MRYRSVIAALLFSAGMINYIDRSALSIAAPLVARDLHLRPGALGVVFGSFFVGYAAFCFIGGYAADRWGPKRTFALAMGFWSLFCGLTAAVGSLVQLVAVRVLFGIGEGPMGTTTNKSVHGWFPRSEAGLVMGIVNAGQPLGGALAGPIVGLVAAAYGWRAAFVVTGLIGLAWLCAWMTWMADTPRQSPRVSAGERALIEAGRPGSGSPATIAAAPLRSCLASPAVLGVALAFFSYNYVLFFFLTWLPTYLSDAYRLDLREMSIVSAIPWLCGSAGMILGGLISDRLVHRGMPPVPARRAVAVVSLGVAAAGVLLASTVHAVVPAVLLIAASNLFLLATPQCCWLLVQELVPAGRVGSVGGFVHLLANLAGIVGPIATGFIVQATGSFSVAFVLAGSLAAVGMLSLLLLVREPPAAIGAGKPFSDPATI